MAMQITASEFTLLRDLIAEVCGIHLNEDKQYLLESRLAQVAREAGCPTFFELYAKIKRGTGGRLLAATIDAITTNETYWFREQRAFRILEQRLLPEFYEELRKERRGEIRIWCAACATGQEPYSVAMSGLDFFRSRGGDEACRRQLRLLATDISESCIAAAKQGVYNASQMARGLPQELRERYFHSRSGSWHLAERVRQLVEFRCHNLRHPLNVREPFDLIFLRNVIIYFADEVKKDLLRAVRRLLAPGGYLFLGNGEALAGCTDGYEVMELDGQQFFRLKIKAPLGFGSDVQ